MAIQSSGQWNGPTTNEFATPADHKWSIRQFLVHLGLEEHIASLHEEGFRTVKDLLDVSDRLSEGDFQSLGFHRMADRKKLIKAIDATRSSPSRSSNSGADRQGRTRVLGLPQEPKSSGRDDNARQHKIDEESGRNTSWDDPFSPMYGYDPFSSPGSGKKGREWESPDRSVSLESALAAQRKAEGRDAGPFDNSPYIHERTNATAGTTARAKAYDSHRRGK